jgi:hypothetical protein
MKGHFRCIVTHEHESAGIRIVTFRLDVLPLAPCDEFPDELFVRINRGGLPQKILLDPVEHASTPAFQTANRRLSLPELPFCDSRAHLPCPGLTGASSTS